MITIGELTLVLLAGSFLTAIFVVTVSFYSIKRGHFYFPRLVKSGLVMSEGMVKGICNFFSLDDKELTAFFIRLHNTMNSKAFSKIESSKRAVFLPQCLRNSQCPANLTPEGLQCRRCGRCEIGQNIDRLENLGYNVWIAPGSTLIKRMVIKYKPEAVIGIGCLVEVKEGLDLLDKINIVGMGVLTMKDGCVETALNWNDLFEVALLGLEDK
ncbi:DUF116 domain-containing protein [Methanoplanus sp. FWC-SCC4]|uniref:DUF116 domain-containing protein n=1 Tax=Methanochimaera problematica TaxID=2609417 RepID=A0AA97I5C7_9EURY|nr:DUF116 domain-containing protein [Methanoplanus sp. FWC-SCC4]WOF17311.1 DUF116 domain-containing protein [Methanoplanus sp. FWC-SCC4]